jgi:hypothetical protein
LSKYSKLVIVLIFALSFFVLLCLMLRGLLVMERVLLLSLPLLLSFNYLFNLISFNRIFFQIIVVSCIVFILLTYLGLEFFVDFFVQLILDFLLDLSVLQVQIIDDGLDLLFRALLVVFVLL